MKRFALMVCALALAAPVLAQDSSGTWQLTVTTTQNAPRTTSMALKKDGDKLSGTLVGPQNVEVSLHGTQTGTDVTLSFSVQTQNGPISVAMKGRQDGESMKGTLEIGNGDRGDWTAARTAAPAAKPSGTSAIDLTGTWALQVTTDAGSGSPTATLKQEGEKLSGRYKGMFGEAPLTGQIKDTAFSFQVTMTIEGSPVTLTYAGTVDQNAVRGRVTFGDLGEGTFTGKKQEAAGR